ncbi:PorV/PorQ family protein [candidate division KSB1 bacterium]|nr:PorV/PorQ family protein [candidate division KSB1 bacterium]
MKKRTWIVLLILGSWFIQPRTSQAQNAAGTIPIFHALGVGARQLGVGGACVAVPFDATTLYWNPAALDYLEYTNATFFYTNLLGGASYNYIGFVQPTLGIGAFGTGILRWGIDGVKEYGDSPYQIGEFGLANYEIIFSYGKILLSEQNLAVGVNLKFEHQSWPGLSVKAADTGVGGDLALFFRPEILGGVQGLAIGLVVQNLFTPKLKPLENSDTFPMQIKLGLAKNFELSTTGNRLLIMMDLVKPQTNASKVHLGLEYTYNNLAMLRAGFFNSANTTNFVFGAGAKYSLFQLDYSYAPLNVADFGASHRLSVSLSLGKSKSARVEQAKQEEMYRIREEVENQQRLAREQEIRDRLVEGRKYFDNGDYVQAQIEFSAVLKLDLENPEAKDKVEQARVKQEEVQNRLLQERIEREKLKEEQIQADLYIREHWQKGLAYYERGQYEEAVDEWNLVLKKDPQYQLAVEFRDRALTDLRNEVKSLIKQAETHAARNQYIDAIRLLDQAKSRNLEEIRLDEDIEAKIRYYSKALNSEQLYRKGLNHYDNREYTEAADAFKQALALDPNNKVLQDYHEKAKARATATNTELPSELKQKYFKGVDLSTHGQYEEALQIFEEILQIQPNNKRVLTTIDKTKEKLEKSRRLKSSSNN